MPKKNKKSNKKDLAKEIEDSGVDYEHIVEHFSNTEEEDLPWEGGWSNSDNLDIWIDENWDIELGK